jgi:hypothetical protein
MEIAEIRARNVDLPNRITMWLMLDEFSRGFCSQDGIRQEIGMVFWVYRDQKNSLRFAYEWKGKFWICTVKARGHVPNENLLSSITVSLFAMGLGDVHKFISFSTLNDGEIPVFGQLFPSAHSHAYGRL